MSVIESKLRKMNIDLEPGKSASPYLVACKTFGNMVFLSGHGSRMLGKVGATLTTEQGVEAAREVAISCLASLKAHLGDLDRIKSIIKLLGMVNSTPDFIEHVTVINGASKLLVELFGDEMGKHARSAVGMATLPDGRAVEIEMIIEINLDINAD